MPKFADALSGIAVRVFAPVRAVYSRPRGMCGKGVTDGYNPAGGEQAVPVEVPVMLLLVKIANNTKGWFDKRER